MQLDPEKTVVVATGNPHKLVEIETILAQVLPDMKFVALGDLGDFEDPVEDGADFFENACIKAQSALANTKMKYAIADDSGLMVDALKGKPGIMSARWAGVHGDDKANNEKLLLDMEGVPEAKRTAHFHSSLVLIDDEGLVLHGQGNCAGKIGFIAHGDHGFGYDPLFWPDRAPGRTMAELAPEEKNSISHRYYALQDLAGKIRGIMK